MFEKTLQDVVKGIRANKRDPSDYISATIADIKMELKSSDAFIKAQAIRKLTYLQMLGYDMSWAAFYVIEVMTMPRFAHKRVGYLAANQCFTEDTEVVLLCTNHLQKEFKSQNPYDVGLAINCLANIATPDLSRDLISDLVQLLGNHKPYVRKKALLAMYKLFIKYPQGLRLTFDRIKERLEDSDSSVVSCAVNVICELADKNPKNYLAMAPQFFRLLTTSSNNWMLIKVVKLLGSLVPEEPRLARKLLEPLATIIQNTAAKSLLYECIHTMTLALPFTRKADGTESKAVPAAVRLCSEHLQNFTEDADQNLKYLGLVGFVNLMQSHPRVVAEHRSLVLACLSDDDVTIRTRALELLSGMVTKRNLEDLVLNLLQHVTRAEGKYRDELIAKIVFVCSRDKYTYLSNFRWYTGVLVDLSHVEGSIHGESLASQLMDVSLRVEEVREYAVHKSVGLLLEPSLVSGRSSSTMQRVLGAAAWIVGEYCRPHLETLARSQRRGERVWFDVIQALLAPEAARLPARAQAVYVQNASKVLTAMCQACSDDGELGRVLDMLPGRLRAFMKSRHIEVQERASSFYYLLITYGIAKEEEKGTFQPGERSAAGGETEEDEGVSDNEASSKAGMKMKGAANGQGAAPPVVVLDLLGLDPQSADGTGTGASNGARNALEVNGDSGGGVTEGGLSSPPMMLEMALAPSMMGPVGAARGAASEMAALVGEVLKPVNQRAQGRVPPPDDVDLDRAIDGSALDKLLAVEHEGPTDLSQLSFTQIRLPKSDHEEYRVSSYGRDTSEREVAEKGSGGKRGKKLRKKDRSSRGSSSRGRDDSFGPSANGLSAIGDDGSSSLGSPYAGGVGGGGGGGSARKNAAEDRYKTDPFYLGGSSSKKLLVEDGNARDEEPAAAAGQSSSGRGHAADDYFDAPTSTALALVGGDSYDDDPYTGRSKGSGRKGKGKDKHGRGEAAYAIDNVEMMPASAVIDSDDDEMPARAGGTNRNSRGKARNARRGSAPSGLAAIDITTPLEEDEVMPEVKPYVRLTAETAGGGRSGGGGGGGAADASTAKGDKKGDGGGRSRRKHHSRERKSSKAGRKDASSRNHGSGRRSASSPSRKKHATPQGGGGGRGGVAEIDLMGFGSPPPGVLESAPIAPPLLLQNAPSPVGTPAAPAAGTAMRAPPPSSLQGTWESDLSAILSAAAPPVQQDAAPVARGGGGSSGLLSDLEGMGTAGAGAEAGASGHERRRGEGSSKTRKHKSSKSSSRGRESSSGKVPKEKRRSRREGGSRG